MELLRQRVATFEAVRRGLPIGAAVVAVALALPAPSLAQGPLGPLNDLFALGQGFGQTPDRVPVVRRAEPPLAATPRAQCGPGSKPEPGIQGRVPEGSATDGLWCNATLVGHQGSTGGFRTWRYVDTHGRECAFYDTALLFPLNAFNPGGASLGVAVLDMSDPAHPVQTDTLTELPTLSPHESLNLNTKRGLLVAVNGNPATYPGVVSVYDVHEDCRHPVLQSTSPVARLGHESGFSADGKTFYATATAYNNITAIDLTDPKTPHAVWLGNVYSHGMSLSEDGNRAYIADPNGHDMLILDVSEIQARKPNPQAREISRLTWSPYSIPQNAIPFTTHGHPYVLEFDEYTESTLNPGGDPNGVGAGRIVDIADESKPQVVSNLRLQVDQPADHAAATGDPGGSGSPQGYAAHYCNMPTRVDPTLVACTFIASGLRVFDISDVAHPTEVAYFVAPTKAAFENGGEASNFAMAQPTFAPERREVWFTDGVSGFYALRLPESVWSPAATQAIVGSCASDKRVTLKVKLPRRAKVRSIRATLAGKKVRATRKGRTVRVVVKMKGLPLHTVRLVVKVKLRGGKVIRRERSLHPCGAR
jgi:hypothetical protein